jgi:hypothetical protein
MFTRESKSSKVMALSSGALALVLLAGCGEDPAEKVGSQIGQADLYGATVNTLTPGDSIFLTVTDSDSEAAQKLIALSPNVSDHIYPHGPRDEKAPTITETPVRFRSQVVLSGSKSNYLDNDAACDTYNVSSSAGSIGVIALGGGEHGVFVVWPNGQDQQVNQIEVCMFQDHEPKDGVIMFTQ